MAYNSGGIIEATDFNSFATQINQIYSDLFPGEITVPYADYGYGAGPVLALVNPGDAVTASGWTALLQRITWCAEHQGTSISPLPSFVNSGSAISVLTDLISKLSDTVTNRKKEIHGKPFYFCPQRRPRPIRDAYSQTDD